MSARTSVGRALAMTALAAAIVSVALPASAHAELVSSIPADGATLTELTTIHLEFSEDLLDIGNSIAVTDGAGTHDLTVTVEGATLDAPVSGLVPGPVTIAWRNASVDGHTEEGELHITLSAPEPSVTPSTSVAPTDAPTVMPVDVPSGSAIPIDSGGGGGTSSNAWLLILLALVAVGGTGAALLAATRRPPTTPTPPEES